MALAAAVGLYLDGGTPTIAQADGPPAVRAVETAVGPAADPAPAARSGPVWKAEGPGPVAEVECAATERRAVEASAPARTPPATL